MILAITPYLVDRVLAGLILLAMVLVAVFGDRRWMR